MFSWVSYLLGYSNVENPEEKSVKNVPIISIKPEDLKAVVLRKHTNPIFEKKLKRPAMARYAPTNSFHLLRLTDEQLKQILGIKLKPTKINEKPKEWKCRHPVLRELKEKIPVF